MPGFERFDLFFFVQGRGVFCKKGGGGKKREREREGETEWMM